LPCYNLKHGLFTRYSRHYIPPKKSIRDNKYQHPQTAAFSVRKREVSTSRSFTNIKSTAFDTHKPHLSPSNSNHFPKTRQVLGLTDRWKSLTKACAALTPSAEFAALCTAGIAIYFRKPGLGTFAKGEARCLSLESTEITIEVHQYTPTSGGPIPSITYSNSTSVSPNGRSSIRLNYGP